MALSTNPTLKEIVDEIERLNNLIINRDGARTITPSTSNQVLSKGNYKGDITVIGDSDLISSNIRSGKNIFGINGSLVEGIPGGKKWASGSLTPTSNDKFTYVSGSTVYMYKVEVTNLSFKPKYIIITDGSKTLSSYCDDNNNDKVFFADGKFLQLISPAYISNNSFCLAGISSGGMNKEHFWIAFE